MVTTTTSSRRPVDDRAWRSSLLRGALVGLELFVGAGAVYGGWQMLRHPDGPLGVTTDLLTGTPFGTYTWPGVLLLVLVGLAPLTLAVGLLLRVRGAVALSALFGVGLMAWILAQWLLIDDRLWLQPAMFAVGAVIAALGAVAHRRGAR